MTKFKEMQRQLMIEASTELFFASGIQSVTMQDIAKELGIGEATVYRYFGKKSNLVLACAVELWKFSYENYVSKVSGNTGYEKIASFFNQFALVFEEHRNLYRFVLELDQYLTSENISGEAINQYDDVFKHMKEVFDEYYREGLMDGSVRLLEDECTYYAMSTHSLLSLCKKLSEGAIIEEDKTSDALKEISMLIDILLQYIKR